MTILSLRTLKSKGACADQVALFKSTFGAQVDVTEALCEAHFDKFNWGWASRYLLTPDARAEYERVVAPAYAELQLVIAQAYAEYQRVRAQADVEHQRVRAPAYAEYERVDALAYTEYRRAAAQADAEYQRVRAGTFGRLFAAQA